MRNGWTGGQYSLFRLVFGLYLLFHCATLLAAGVVQGPAAGLAAAAALLAVAFAAGYRDRAAAGWLVLAGIGLGVSDPATATFGSAGVGLLLLAHLFLPPAPFGAWSARRRPDPGGGWRMPDAVHASAWVLLALAYVWSGVSGWAAPAAGGLLRIGAWLGPVLELAFAPLALLRRVRPWIWLAALVVHLASALVLGTVDLNAGLVFLLLFAFDPAWIRPVRADGEEFLFYDGGCGLCHAAVRAVLAEDRGDSFRFAPLGGATFLARVPEAERGRLPDSIVVLCPNPPLLTRSRALAHIGKRVGGIWRLAGAARGLLPAALADAAYDAVASVRHRLFPRPVAACPVLPARLRGRFDD